MTASLPMSRRAWRDSLAPLLVALLVAALLSACGNSRVVRRDGAPSATPARSSQPLPRDGAYTVRSGDTLFGIAFRHGLDYRELAARNRIPPPYTIYPGQRLSLGAARVASAPRPVRTRPVATPSRGSVTGMPAPVRDGRRDPAAASVSALPPDRTTGPALPTTPPAATPRVIAPATSPASLEPAPLPATVGAGGWRWPTQGQLIGRFAAGDPKRQGLDIAGTAGQAVVAASDGVVVYSGAGLVGYGELIIIKHSDEWLSAYAHNRKRLVGEGTAVKAGQPIAELGRSGTSRDMLHFEVRRNGKPVDPLQVLPKP